jgi:hypothetical protein
MKSPILLLALAIVILSSCSSAYKTGQTPDDVYFSPAPPADEYVQVEKRDDRSYKGSDQYYEDRYLRMRVQNRYQWSVLDDYYFNSPYAYNYYGSYSNWYNPFNSYWTWNTYYNPYCYGSVIIKNPGYYHYRVPPSKPVAFNLNSYTNSGNRSTAGRSIFNNNNSRYNNSNSNSFGNSVRKLFSNSNSNYNSGNNSTPSRSYNPSSSGSSGSRSSSSSSSSSSSGSRPHR